MQIPDISQCSCGSRGLAYEPMSGHPHHGKLVCVECEKFHIWTSKRLSRFLDRLYGVRRAIPSKKVGFDNPEEG